MSHVLDPVIRHLEELIRHDVADLHSVRMYAHPQMAVEMAAELKSFRAALVVLERERHR